MSDNYSGEMSVCNWLHRYLISNSYTIVQLICPGAQATLSIRYDSPSLKRAKIIFPDLLAISSSSIVVGELKEGFSISDKDKMLDLSNSSNGSEKVRILLERVTSLDLANRSIEYLLVHSDFNAVHDRDISQLILNDDKNAWLKKL